MRWVMVAVAMLGFALAFGTSSVGMLAFGLLLGCVGLVGAFIAFAAARVESVSQAQSTRELSMIIEARKQKARRGDAADSSPTAHLAVASGDGGPRGKPGADGDRSPDGNTDGGDGGGGGD